MPRGGRQTSAFARERPRVPPYRATQIGVAMLVVRILLVLLALVSPALAEDGLIDAAAAREAAQAFRVYVEGGRKKASGLT